MTVRLGGHTWHGRTGFRSVSLEREAFRIGVNGEPVFVRGVNWIPDDCFPARLTRRRISDRLDQALAAGVNLFGDEAGDTVRVSAVVGPVPDVPDVDRAVGRVLGRRRPASSR
ncbi:hypothetical protein [Streptomyces sp. NPDC058394]|uniref:hypothetical protein n=1 Tax=unclassified Streptomyces TaxID=2593676 RepID=UPI003660F4A2